MGRNLPSKIKKEEYLHWTCPYCGTKNTAPETATSSRVCPNCGRESYGSGVEVEDEKTKRLFKEIERRRKKEIIADEEHE